MPHHVGAWKSLAARCATATALFVFSGCDARSSATIVVVSTAGEAVIASPVDPRPFFRRSSANSAESDLLARYYAAADSADALDGRFQREREALHGDAAALTGADRRTDDYARRYQAYMARAEQARTLRAARDRARTRSAQLREEMRRAGVTVAPPNEPGSDQLDRAARAAGRRIVRSTLTERVASLALEPGTWWIGIEHGEGVLSDVQRHEIRPGVRDTLTLGAQKS